jgi:hypothetical protein
MEFSQIIYLLQDCSYSILGGINLEDKGFVIIGTVQDWVACDDSNQFVYCFSAFICPLETLLLLQ